MKLKNTIIIICAAIFINACIEPANIEGINYKDFIAVEASVTSEVKRHTVKITRTSTLEAKETIKESGAIVSVEDDSQNIFRFIETSNGEYESENEFKAEVGKAYTLKITTKDGKAYASSAETITGIAAIDEITAVREFNSLDEEGIQIYVQSKSEDENAKYFRYEYEETYKIRAPYYSPNKAIPHPFTDEVILIVPDLESAEICYATQKSNKLVQTDVANLSSNEVDFGVRFIARDNYIIRHRYSILLKQHVQSFEAYRYFQTLNELSSIENVFNQNQPGFLSGNIRSVNDPKEKVIGFFEVNSVSTKRFFLNGIDFFIDIYADYPASCSFGAPPIKDMADNVVLAGILRAGTLVYYKDYAENLGLDLGCDNGAGEGCGPYVLVSKACGDCRVLGSEVKPDFWID